MANTQTQVPYEFSRADSVTEGNIVQARHGDIKWGAVIEVLVIPADPEGYEVDPIAPFVPAIRIRTTHADAPDQTRYFRAEDELRVVR